MSWSLRAARPSERQAALTLLFRYLPFDEAARRTAAVLATTDRGEVDPAGLIVAVLRDHVVGAILALPLTGAVGLIYPPQVQGNAAAAEDALVAHACGWLHARGVRVAQGLAVPRDVAHFAALQRNGFVRLCRLWYLRHDLEPLPERAADGPAFRLVPCRDVGERFGRTLLATYQDTLDFPELTGWRTLDEVLAGHREAGADDPDRWWLIESGGLDAGVVLVGSFPETGEWDLSYLGLVPAARGRGLGRAVLGEILRRAAAGRASRLVLAVDERNAPAWRLYRAAGFVPDEAREIFLKLGLAPGDSPVSPNAPDLP